MYLKPLLRKYCTISSFCSYHKEAKHLSLLLGENKSIKSKWAQFILIIQKIVNWELVQSYCNYNNVILIVWMILFLLSFGYRLRNTYNTGGNWVEWAGGWRAVLVMMSLNILGVGIVLYFGKEVKTQSENRMTWAIYKDRQISRLVGRSR